MEPVWAKVLSLQSKLSNAPLSWLVASRAVGSDTRLSPAVVMICSVRPHHALDSVC